MVRFFSLMTLALVAICLAIGVSIAIADDSVPAPQPTLEAPAIEAIQPDERLFDDSLAAAEDIYEFDFDFVVTTGDDAGDEENPEIVINHNDILEI